LRTEPRESDANATGDTDSSGHFGQKTELAFNPLPIDGIAILFQLSANQEDNLHLWKMRASKATENGLISARTTKGSGRAQSKFNPALVANWLIAKGELKAEHAARKLSKALPARSAELKEELFPDI
jgi:hypothetical protein